MNLVWLLPSPLKGVPEINTFITQASTDLNRMISGIAELQVLYLSRQVGWHVPNAWTGQMLGQHKIYFSALFFRCQAACLVS